MALPFPQLQTAEGLADLAIARRAVDGNERADRMGAERLRKGDFLFRSPSRGCHVRRAEAIDELPGVRESAVVGVPHPDFGEAVTAVVVARHGDAAAASEDDILAALRERLANFKVPKRVYFVDELPRNTMGKVQKNILRERYSGPPGGT